MNSNFQVMCDSFTFLPEIIKKIKIRINFILTMSKPNYKFCFIIFFEMLEKLTPVFGKLKSYADSKQESKFQAQFRESSYKEKKVGVTLSS